MTYFNTKFVYWGPVKKHHVVLKMAFKSLDIFCTYNSHNVILSS